MSALDAGLKRLSARALSRGELRQRLLARFPEREVDAALNRLVELGYINDRRLAFDRAEDALANGRGPELIRARLAAAQIDEPALGDALAALSGRVEQACLDLLRSKLGPAPDARALMRARRLALSRGFDQELVESLLRRHWPRTQESAS
jgi:regulatory protein